MSRTRFSRPTDKCGVAALGAQLRQQRALCPPEVSRFEKEFLQFVETSNPSILKNIAEKKALDDSIKAEIKKALDSFKERFTAAVAAAAK